MRQQDKEQQAEAVQTLSQHSPLIQCTVNPICPVTQSLKLSAYLPKMQRIKTGSENLGEKTTALDWLFQPCLLLSSLMCN